VEAQPTRSTGEDDPCLAILLEERAQHRRATDALWWHEAVDDGVELSGVLDGVDGERSERAGASEAITDVGNGEDPIEVLAPLPTSATPRSNVRGPGNALVATTHCLRHRAQFVQVNRSTARWTAPSKWAAASASHSPSVPGCGAGTGWVKMRCSTPPLAAVCAAVTVEEW